MESEDPSSQNFELTLTLLNSAADGHFDALECPECHKPSVSVWFTHPRDGEYRTWFLCQECPFSTRAQNSERPNHFSDSRVHKALEKYDFEFGNNRKFPPPTDPEGG